MTSIYERRLPEVFPYSVRMDKETIKRLVMLLINRDDIPALSSFSVQTGIDSDVGPKLWLSSVSVQFLKDNNALPPLVRKKIVEEYERAKRPDYSSGIVYE